MGAPEARVQLTGERLDLEWPAVASCTDLAIRCGRGDGTAYGSTGWTAEADGRFRTTCGPLEVQIAVEPTDGCVRLQAEVTALVDVDVARVVLSATPVAVDTELAWVLYNGYQSWDAAGVLPAGSTQRESWWTVALADADGAGLPAAAVDARCCCTQFTFRDGVLGVVWREAEMLEALPSLFSGGVGARWRSDAVLISASRDVRTRLGAMLRPWSPALPV